MEGFAVFARGDAGLSDIVFFCDDFGFLGKRSCGKGLTVSANRCHNSPSLVFSGRLFIGALV
jgi:hypothetical protein